MRALGSSGGERREMSLAQRQRRRRSTPRRPAMRFFAALVLPLAGELIVAGHGPLGEGVGAFVFAGVVGAVLAVLPLLGTPRGGRALALRVVVTLGLALVAWGSSVTAQRLGGGPVDPALTGLLGGYLVAWGF